MNNFLPRCAVPKRRILSRCLHATTTGMMAVALLNSMLGCETAQRTVSAGESQARHLLGHVEPTGIIAETGARKETWETFRQKADEIDISTFNEAVDNLAIVARKMSSRLDACSDDDVQKITADMSATLSALRLQVEQTNFAEASLALTHTANTLNKQIELLSISELNSVLVETKLAVRNVQTTGTKVQEHIAVSAKDIRVLSNEVAKVLQQLPMDALEKSIQDINSATAQIASISESWPASAAKIEDTVTMLHLGSRVGIGVLALFGLCLIVWLLKNFKSSQSS